MRSEGKDLSEEKMRIRTDGKSKQGMKEFFLVLVITFVFFIMGQAQAVPVIIGEDSGGSWSDSFTDSTGIESMNNLSVNEKNVRLIMDTDILWEHEYTADLEPDVVGWSLTKNAVGDLASASGGILTLDTTSENAYWWYTRSLGATNSVGVTLEARLKVISSNYETKIFIRDGTYYEAILIFPDRIQTLGDTIVYNMDTTDSFHTYRFTVKNNDYMVYVDGVLGINGAGQHDLGTTGNVCNWGDTDDFAGRDTHSQWDYVRYNISGAFPPGPVTYNTSGELVSSEISLPTGMTWDSLIINKTEPGTDNFINVSVLNGSTSKVILGFENLTDTNIDLASLDHITYPTIKLHGTFEGNYSDTPVLHDWTVTWVDTIPPATPTGLKVNNPFTGYSQILSWNSNTEGDLSGYALYYSTDNSTFDWLINISTGTISFLHSGLASGTPYYYKIAAYDEVPNQSPFSQVVNGTPDLDYDGDGIGNMDDPDDDNDGISDIDDPYPYRDINDIEVTLDNLTIDIDMLRTWLEVVIYNVEANINATNDTLHQQLDDLDSMMTNFYNYLTDDIGKIQTDLMSHDQNTDQNHSIQIGLLNDLLEGQIEKEKIEELRTMLVDLAGNLSEHNQSMADDIMGVVNNIDEFEANTDEQLDSINLTLKQLAQLEDILGDLEALDQSLEQVEEDLQDSLDDKSTRDEDEDRFFVIELFLILLFILLIINMILTVVMGKRRGEERGQQMQKPPPKTSSPMPPPAAPPMVPPESPPGEMKSEESKGD